MANAPVWIYGINSVLAMVEAHPAAVYEIRVAERIRNARVLQLCAAARAMDIVCREQPAQAFERFAAGRGHQGVAALCRLPAYLGERDLGPLCAEPCNDAPAFLILDRVTDPANLGACLRSAEVCAATAVIVPSSNAAELTPAAVKAASGAVGRVPLARVPNLARALGLLQRRGVWIVAAQTGAERRLCEVNCRRPIAFVLGGEGAGLRRRTVELCDYSAAIPMQGKVESLNVSTAAAICLYEMRRQRDGMASPGPGGKQ